jgi:hypothetical protein
MHPLYYYFGAPSSDSTDDNYDPTRECFHIDGAIASDSEAEAAIGGRTPCHLTLSPPAHGMRPNFWVQIKEQNLSRSRNYKPCSMRNEKTYAYFSKPLSGST